MPERSLFIAATGQNVGKTTLCLGLIAGLKKRFARVGFIKPVGQQHISVTLDTIVDKDAVLFRNYFGLSSDWHDMSPVIIPSGLTRKYIDGKVSVKHLLQTIETSFKKISLSNDYTVVEGTGHVGVGSIIDLNNAKVAASLGLDIVIIASGGLGSAFDELALNIALCKEYGVSIRGVILNRVRDDKREMILDYFPRALKKWNIPLIGCVPYNEFLNSPTMRDYEALFHTSLLSGEQHHYRHFKNFKLVAGSLEAYREDIIPNELVITPATREDIIEATLQRHVDSLTQQGIDFKGGIILTGRHSPSPHILEALRKVDIPSLYAPLCSFDAMKMITSYIAKIRVKDIAKIEQAISLTEEYIDFERLCTPSSRELKPAIVIENSCKSRP